MKTITEFAALNLKNAEKTRQELVSAGKTPEELPQALGEALKVEGDKLKHLLEALDALKGKVNDLKRAVVHSIAEGEKAPSHAVVKEGFAYVIEYYPPLAKKEDRHARGKGEGRHGGRGGRDGKKGGRGGKPGRGPGRGGEGQTQTQTHTRGPRGPRPEGAPGEGGGDRRPGGRGRRGPGGPGRGPRPDASSSMTAAPNPGTGKRPKVIIVKPNSGPAPTIKPVEKPAVTEASRSSGSGEPGSTS
jgi:hypothetical protein